LKENKTAIERERDKEDQMLEFYVLRERERQRERESERDRERQEVERERKR
jgi:hypothetical protein